MRAHASGLVDVVDDVGGHRGRVIVHDHLWVLDDRVRAPKVDTRSIHRVVIVRWLLVTIMHVSLVGVAHEDTHDQHHVDTV